METSSSGGECEGDDSERSVSPCMLMSNSREMRNRAEKQRRDRLNGYVGELATLVPMVARSAKRMDKTSILRLAATYLRIHQTLENSSTIPRMDMPRNVDQQLLEKLVCEELGGFLLILTLEGKIIFISNTVENLLGHLQVDLMGQFIFVVLHPDDQQRVRSYLRGEGSEAGDWRRQLHVRLRRAGPRNESPTYEQASMMGVRRRADNGRSSEAGQSARDGGVVAAMAGGQSLVNRDVVIFFVQVLKPDMVVNRVMQASTNSYRTRHLIDSTIITCEHTISTIAGYLIEEVNGQSAFLYMHKDEVRWVMIALRQMYDRGERSGNSCYRLKARNGQFIYLRTEGYLEVDSTGTVESFVCINTMVDEEEGKRLIAEMKNRYSALIGSIKNKEIEGEPEDTKPEITQPLAIEEPEPGVEDPQKVHEAISQLISNLPSPGCSDQRSTPSPTSSTGRLESQDCQLMSPSPHQYQYVTPITSPADTHQKYSYQVCVKNNCIKRSASIDSNAEEPRRSKKMASIHRDISIKSEPPDQQLYQPDPLLGPHY